MHTVLTAELRLCQQDCSCSPALSKGKNPWALPPQVCLCQPTSSGGGKGSCVPRHRYDVAGVTVVRWENSGWLQTPSEKWKGRRGAGVALHVWEMFEHVKVSDGDHKFHQMDRNRTWKLQGLSPGKAQEWVCLEGVPSQMKLETGKSQEKLPKASQAWLTCVSFCKNVSLFYKKLENQYCFCSWSDKSRISLHCYNTV